MWYIPTEGQTGYENVETAQKLQTLFIVEMMLWQKIFSRAAILTHLCTCQGGKTCTHPAIRRLVGQESKLRGGKGARTEKGCRPAGRLAPPPRIMSTTQCAIDIAIQWKRPGHASKTCSNCTMCFGQRGGTARAHTPMGGIIWRNSTCKGLAVTVTSLGHCVDCVGRRSTLPCIYEKWVRARHPCSAPVIPTDRSG